MVPKVNTADSFQQYPGMETQVKGGGNGKGHGQNPVPEPAVYGAAMVSLILVIFLLRRHSTTGSATLS